MPVCTLDCRHDHRGDQRQCQKMLQPLPLSSIPRQNRARGPTRALDISAPTTQSQFLDLLDRIVDLHSQYLTTEECSGLGRIANVTLPVPRFSRAHPLESQH